MAGVSHTIEGRDIAAEAEARRDAVREINPDFVADPNASFRDNFLDASGVARGAMWGHQGIWNEGDVVEVIAHQTPAEFLDAVALADPSQQEVIDLAKADPRLVEAIHSAVVNDPTMLEGVQEVLSTEDGATDLKAILENSTHRGILTDVLQNIGNGSTDASGADIDYSHLRAILDAENIQDRVAAVKAAGAGDSINPFANVDSFQDIIEILKNPQQFMASIMEALEGLPPQYQNMLAGGIDLLSKGLGNFLDPQGEWAGTYIRAGADIGKGLAQHGEGVIAQAKDVAQAAQDRLSEEMNQPGAFEGDTGTQTRTSDLGPNGNMSQEQVRAAAGEEPANVDPANSPAAPTREVAEVLPPSMQPGGLAG